MLPPSKSNPMFSRSSYIMTFLRSRSNLTFLQSRPNPMLSQSRLPPRFAPSRSDLMFPRSSFSLEMPEVDRFSHRMSKRLFDSLTTWTNENLLKKEKAPRKIKPKSKSISNASSPTFGKPQQRLVEKKN